MGDDITDVDAFNKLRELVSLNKIEGVAIAVKSVEVPPYVVEHADYWVDDVDEVGRFLRWLTENS